jgi:hypothetical protein
MSPSSHRRKIWMMPGLLAVLTLTGLLSALLGEQVGWKALCWIALGIPIATAGWHVFRQR